MLTRLAALLMVAALLAACTAWSHVNRAGAPAGPPGAGPGRVAVALALSGGGVRAAALAWGVMRELGRLSVPAEDGSPSTLLREVDYVSSVSGGSFAAAYWALHRDDPAALERFADAFLYPNHERRVAWRAFGNPVNWVRLPFTAFDRTDVAARYYSRALFDGRAYGALPPRPRLIVNASDLVTGSRFEFSDEFFGCLGASLGDYPIAYAVAASSAYPAGFAAVTLRNFGSAPGGCLTTSDRAALQSAHLNPEAWLRATRKQRFLETERVPYVHLVDGGITDNLGLQGIIERLTDGELSDLLNTRKLAGVVVIVVNAMPAHDDTLGRHAESPGVLKVADQSFGLMLEQASTRTSRLVRAAIDERRVRGGARPHDAAPLPGSEAERSRDARAARPAPGRAHASGAPARDGRRPTRRRARPALLWRRQASERRHAGGDRRAPRIRGRPPRAGDDAAVRARVLTAGGSLPRLRIIDAAPVLPEVSTRAGGRPRDAGAGRPASARGCR